ncbi:Dipeptide transport ATP-binding protein DppD [Candidatus Entotheonellaceae bacterium PAL068K]
MPLLEVENLSVKFGSYRAVDRVSLSLTAGTVLGVVGESGSGKSVTMLALMGLIRSPGQVTTERLRFDGIDLTAMRPRARRQITGKEVAMIFQEPLTSLNPCFTVGFQIAETLKAHQGGRAARRRDRAVALLDRVGIPAAASRLRAFPHQLSGGMNQRVMIAMAIACHPKLLIADEPTTALDVTIQAQILDLLLTLQQERDMALILITHDMGVVAETAHQVAVMYAGQVVEQGAATALFKAPRHPYTEALLNTLPERHASHSRLPTISGVVPGLYDWPSGCLFHPRCRYADARCRHEPPHLRQVADSLVRCHYPLGPMEPTA